MIAFDADVLSDIWAGNRKLSRRATEKDGEVMSTTIELEIDLFVAAESRARQEHRPVNNVVNQLLRKALCSPSSFPSTTSNSGTHFTVDSATGLPEVKGDRALDSDDVARIDWELG